MSAAQRTPEWFAERAAMSVTGSMVGAILGHNKHCRPEQALRNKVRECLGLPPDRPTNALMQKGIDLEPTAREAYEVHTGRFVQEVGVCRSENIDWIGSSPDGLLDDRCLEIKIRETPRPIAERPYEKDQCQLHMICTGRTLCDYWQWNENGGVLETVEFDHDWWELHGNTLYEFHDDLQLILSDPERQKPYREPLVTERDDSEYLDAAAAYATEQVALKAAQEREKVARNTLIKLAAGKACTGGGVSVTPYQRAGSVDYSKVPELAGVDLDAYRTSASTSYRITIK